MPDTLDKQEELRKLKRAAHKANWEQAKVVYADEIKALQFQLIDKVLELVGYHFEKAHPSDCECHQFGSDSSKDGYWKDGDFVPMATLENIRKEI
jgi:hypothetical protein